MIERTPEVAEKFRSSRFCRLKKSSKTSLASAKSSSNVVVTSTPTSASSLSSSSSSPIQKRAKYESPENKFDFVSPVCERKINYSAEKSSKIERPSEEISKSVRTESLSSVVSKVQLEKVQPLPKLSEEEKPLTYKYGRHRVVGISRPKGPFGEIHAALETDDSEKKVVNCVLRGSWVHTAISEGDIINLVSSKIQFY